HTNYKSNMILRQYHTVMTEISSIHYQDGEVHWTLLDDRQGCKFEVRTDGQATDGLVAQHSYDVSNLDHCAFHKVSVTPVHFNGNRGRTLQFMFERDITGLNIKSFEVNETDGQIIALWDGDRHPLCKVLISVNDHEFSPINSIDGERILDETDIRQCFTYNITARYQSPESDKEGPIASIINFHKRIQPIVKIDININEIGYVYTTLHLIAHIEKCGIKIEPFSIQPTCNFTTSSNFNSIVAVGNDETPSIETKTISSSATLTSSSNHTLTDTAMRNSPVPLIDSAIDTFTETSSTTSDTTDPTTKTTTIEGSTTTEDETTDTITKETTRTTEDTTTYTTDPTTKTTTVEGSTTTEDATTDTITKETTRTTEDTTTYTTDPTTKTTTIEGSTTTEDATTDTITETTTKEITRTTEDTTTDTTDSTTTETTITTEDPTTTETITDTTTETATVTTEDTTTEAVTGDPPLPFKAFSFPECPLEEAKVFKMTFIPYFKSG
ncbi:hypothetical protein AMK59_6381, partial [Oryctes borbonicus]